MTTTLPSAGFAFGATHCREERQPPAFRFWAGYNAVLRACLVLPPGRAGIVLRAAATD